MSRRLLAVAVGLALASGCAVVKATRLRSDWNQVDRARVRRLVVVTSPLPDGKPSLGALWSRIARRYANQKRNFLVRSEQAEAALPDGPKALCHDGAEGVLWLFPQLSRRGNGVETSVEAQLVRCVDGQEVWFTRAGGSWPTADPVLRELTADYVREFGGEVEPYAAATFHLLKATLDTLPDPVLNDDDVSEKIELGE